MISRKYEEICDKSERKKKKKILNKDWQFLIKPIHR